MKLNSYEKLKLLTKKLLKYEIIRKDLEEFRNNNISESTYAKFITKLNHIKLLEQSEKGVNVLSNDYFNPSYFFDKEKNVSIIASIAHIEKKDIKFKILEYLFKLVPKNLSFMLINNYSKKFDENIIKLFDEKKIRYFATIIKENHEAKKVTCQIFNSKENLYQKIVPLEMFIYEDTWFICCFNILENNLEIIDSYYITELTILNDDYTNYISYSKIDEEIKNYINETTIKKDLIFLRLKPVTLNLLIEFDLIADYTLYEEIGSNTKFFNDSKLKTNISINNKISTKKLHKINLDSIGKNLNNSNDNFNTVDIYKNKSVFFDKEISKKYFVKLEITPKKLDYILRQFKSIEIVNIDNYEILES